CPSPPFGLKRAHSRGVTRSRCGTPCWWQRVFAKASRYCTPKTSAPLGPSTPSPWSTRSPSPSKSGPPMPVERMWRSHDLKPTYDVVIIGGGVHGLAIAYYLGKRGVANVAVLDRGYLGGGASGRNTAIIRSNYRTPEGVAFYDESVKLYERLAVELDYNV